MAKVVSIKGQRYGGRPFVLSLTKVKDEPYATIKRLFRQRVEWCEATLNGEIVGGIEGGRDKNRRQWWSEH